MTVSSLTAEQLAIRDAPEPRICVIACAGSGKTRTAISRCYEMQRRSSESKGRLALLSFSNVAVETFRKQFAEGLGRADARRGGVLIDTFDGFFTSHVLRPHGAKVMGASRTPYLVTGLEPFLSGNRLLLAQKPYTVDKVKVSVEGGKASFYVEMPGGETKISIPRQQAMPLVTWLASHGAYTHELGRYWVYRVLAERPFVLRALAARHPQLLVDEAQDIGAMHEAILSILDRAGVRITLIGDPSQGIYEFAGATGEYLCRYAERADVRLFGLTTNFRSIESIVGVANRMSGRADQHASCNEELLGGAYWATFEKGKEQEAIAAFSREAEKIGLSSKDVAVLCRGADRSKKLEGTVKDHGRGAVQNLCKAAIMRDVLHRYLAAFELAAAAILSLTSGGPTLADVVRSNKPEHRSLRRAIWAFVRDKETGLPSADVSASQVWIVLLQRRLLALFSRLEADHGISALKNFANRVSKAKLPDAVVYDLTTPVTRSVRVSTVHKVKGESIGAVMYIASEKHATELAQGVKTELGKIGYVALTRASRLFLLAIPREKRAALVPRLESIGLREAPFALS